MMFSSSINLLSIKFCKISNWVKNQLHSEVLCLSSVFVGAEKAFDVAGEGRRWEI
jgi:hypothetical protein